MSTRRITIAIDGPASSGKGTVARRLAQALGYAYIDTGAMFRAVGLAALEAGLPLDDNHAVATLAEALPLRFGWSGGRATAHLGPREVTVDIRREDVGQAASAVAVLPGVRRALLMLQRSMAVGGGVVMDGRDIGTVVLPGADLKIYLDASPDERARRRHAELHARGEHVAFDAVLADLRARDAQDSGRAEAPLREADDAVRLDSTGRPPDEVLQAIVLLALDRGACLAEPPAAE